MRTLRLARAVAEAERLRWRARMRRLVLRALLAGFAAIFACATLALLHVAAFIALLAHLAPLWSALLIAGVDLLLACLLLILALLGGPGEAEREALAVRNLAWREMRNALVVFTLMNTVRRAMRRRPAR